ncbi:sulfurtransferase [Caenispirillum salinarum]|uniref:sulfurtransferase n=1 Tax=Caenispirillum salinarum TaxID=859058 RepID=UPI003850A83A
MRTLYIAASAAVLLAAGTAAAQAEGLTDRPLVDPAWLESNLDAENLVVIDIRDPEYDKDGKPKGPVPYTQGHIPGSLAAPYVGYAWRTKTDGTPGMLPTVPTLEEKIGALGIDEDTHVVIIPAGEDSSDFGSATRVYWTFKVMGHDEVSILEGGHKAWVAAGKPLSTEGTQPSPAIFEAEFRPEMIATAEDVRQALDGKTALVDARPTEQYLGQAKSPVAKVSGTIPGSANIANGLFYDGRTAQFAEPSEIDSLLEQVGIEKNQPQIAYCNTGHWASVAWFGLSEVAGAENVSMYDGSLAEWTRDADNPMVVYGNTN